MRKTRAIILGLLLFGANQLPPRAFGRAQSASSASEPKSYDLMLVGTVTKLYPVAASRSLRRWAVVVRVSSVLSGEFSGPTFTFTVHSPARAGLRVDRAYVIKATKTGDGYLVDELTLEEVPSGQSAKPQIYGAPDGLTGDECEGIMMRLDFVAIAAEEAGSDQTVIIISRLGSGESARSLNRSRLTQVADYLNRRIARERIVSAEGARVKGLGQLEFYVAGKLHIIFKVRRNRDLVRGCGENEYDRVRAIGLGATLMPAVRGLHL